MRALKDLPRIAELSLEAARQAGSLAVSLARSVAEPVLGRHGDNGSHRSTAAPPPPAAPAPGRAQRAAQQPRAATAAAAPPPPAPAPAPPRPVAVADAPAAPAEPGHVDRDAVVVAESADAGAADGAGAQIRVEVPWDGYSRLNARDVVAQLAAADPATLAVVRLYESSNRKRRTVLAEVDRRLVTGGG